jgi:SprT protein
MLIRVVASRKSKHGDHRYNKGTSEITVNNSGNCWQFLITLLHEIAHAQVTHRIAGRVSPHGPEWKNAFSNLLLKELDLFPPVLMSAVQKYSFNPLYSSGAHVGLASALRQFDTANLR